MWFLLNFNFLFFSFFYSRLPLSSPKALKAKLQPHLFFFSRWEIKTCVLLDPRSMKLIFYSVMKWLEKLLKYFALFCLPTCPLYRHMMQFVSVLAINYCTIGLNFHPSVASFSQRIIWVHGNLNKLHVSQQSREISEPLLNWHLLISFVPLLWLTIGGNLSRPWDVSPE